MSARRREPAVAAPRPRRGLAARAVPSGRWLIAGFGVVAAAAAAYGVARGTSLFAVERIEVEGAGSATAARVRAALEPLRGRSLLTIGGNTVEARLAALPEVRSASYDRAFPHVLRVRIQPTRPVAVLRQGAESWLVSDRARVVRAVTGRPRSPLPRIWVPRGVRLEAGTTVAEPAVAEAVAAAAAVARARVGGERVRFVRAGHDRLAFVLGSGLELRLGDTQELRLKLAIARRILARGDPGAYLDVSLPERPVAGAESQVEG